MLALGDYNIIVAYVQFKNEQFIILGGLEDGFFSFDYSGFDDCVLNYT